jgi:hypothetical protein
MIKNKRMFVTAYRLEDVKEYTNCMTASKNEYYFKWLSDKLSRHVPYLTEENTEISDKQIKFTVKGGIWDFFMTQEFIAVPSDEKGAKYRFYKSKDYLLKVIKEEDMQSYSLYMKCNYVEKINIIENAVFCYGIHKVGKHFIEVYDNHMTLKEFENEIKDQRGDDKDNINILNKISYSVKVVYYMKMAKFIDDMHKVNERGVITLDHVFIDKNGDMKFIPNNHVDISDQLFQAKRVFRWITKGDNLSDLNALDPSPIRDITMFLEGIHSYIKKNEITYENITDAYKHIPKEYVSRAHIKEDGIWV